MSLEPKDRASAAFASGSATLHGFGLKGDTFRALRYELVSADSMAWSYRGRHEPGCSPSHKSEANCPRFAMRWRDQLLT